MLRTMGTQVRRIANRWREVVWSMRPHQWVKNLFVLAPLVFSKQLFRGDAVTGLAAFSLFCLASGAVYLMNDIFDLHADRLHPIKRNRPIASGALPLGVAISSATTIVGAALLGAFALEHRFALVLAGYLVLNLCYSKTLKHIPYVDVLTIATGFVLRVYGGAFAIDVEVSVWLTTCTFLLSAYLALGKRKHELTGSTGDTARAVLAAYSGPILNVLMFITAIAAIGCYTLYALDPATEVALGTNKLPWTIPMAAIGIVRFAMLVRHQRWESPTEAMFRDPFFVFNLGAWALLMLWLLFPLVG